MVPRRRMAALDIDTPLNEVVAIVASSPYSRLPVYRESLDNVVGVLHTRDLVQWFVDGSRQATLAELIRPLPAVHESVTADRVLRLYRERRAHQALVVDEFGGRLASSRSRTSCRNWSAKWATSSRAARPVAEPLPDGRVRLPGACRSTMPPRRWKRVGHRRDHCRRPGHRRVGDLPEPGDRPPSAEVLFQVERVADRALDSVLASRVAHRRGRRAMSVVLSHSPSSLCSCWRTRSSSPPNSPSSERRAPRSSTTPVRAAGWPARCRASWSRPGCRTATSPRPRSASRWRAWVWGCTASTYWPAGSRRGCSPTTPTAGSPHTRSRAWSQWPS